MKRFLSSGLFKVIISLSLIIILMYIMRGSYNEITSALKRTNVGVLALGFGVYLAALAVASYRLLLIVRAQGVTDVSFREAASLTLIGLFFNNFLPTSIGGDLAKAYYLSRKTGERVGSFASVLVDRLIGLLTMIFMASAAVLLIQSSIISEDVRQALYWVTAGALIVVLFVLNKTFAKKFSGILLLFKPIEHRLREAYNVIHRYKNNKRLIGKSLVISIMSQLLFYSSFGVVALSIGSKISPLDALLRIPLVSLMSMLPSMNGLGLREGATVVLFGPLIGKDKAFAVSILWIFILLLSSVIGGLIYALSPQFRVKLEAIQRKEAL